MGNRFMQPLRIAVQWLYLFFCLWLGWRFFQFVLHFRTAGATPFVSRPEGVEAFLPIAALMGVREWLATGRINPFHPAAVVILLSVILVSMLLRRSFCSWICPVGTVSELLWKRGFSLMRRNISPPRWLDLLLRSPKYLLLAFFLYSIFLAMSAPQVSAFLASDYAKVADVRLLEFFLNLSGTPLVVILVLLLLSLQMKNPFCRYLCPYGALLGLAALLSPAKVTRHKEQCVSCGVCNQLCPANIPVMEKSRVHSTECIGCWRCISHCRAEGALSMDLPGRKIAIPGIIFTILVIAIFWGGTLAGKLSGHWQTAITTDEYSRLLGGR